MSATGSAAIEPARLLEACPDMVVAFDLDGNQRFVSPACARLLGFESGDLLGKNATEAIHPEDQALVAATCRALLSGTVAPACIYRQRDARGGWVTLEAVYALLREAPDHAPSGFVASVRPVGDGVADERGRAALVGELHERNRLLEMAERLAHVGHWRLAADGESVFWSPEVYAIHGVGRDFRPAIANALGFYHPDDVSAVSRAVEAARAEGRGFAFQARIVRPSGELRWIQASGQPDPGPDGEALGVVGVIQDITERIENEQRLTQAREEAELALEAKLRFTSMISHELRTPLAGVLSAARLLPTARNETDRWTYLASLEHSAEMLAALVDDVLTFGKLRNRTTAVSQNPVDLPALVDEVVAALASGAAEKGLTLDWARPEGALFVTGDRVAIRSILVNLVGNAIKFTHKGGVRLWIEADAARDTLELFVSDTGIGIAADARERVFEPYRQADERIARRFGGTGLGLSIARDLAEAMGGRIRHGADPSGGSRFGVTLPRCVAPPPAPASATAPLRSLHVLVADDNTVNRFLVRRTLEEGGHRVIEASGGIPALRALWRAERPVDVVLMDLNMPGVDGIAATRRLKRRPRFAAIPVIALTADAAADRDALLRSGFDEVLVKPVTDAVLADALRKATGPDASERGSSPDPSSSVFPDEDRLAAEHVAPLLEKADQLAAALGPEAAQRFWNELVRDTRERVGRLEAAYRDRAYGAARAEAHALLGSALAIGAGGLAAALRAFQAALASDNRGADAMCAVMSQADQLIAGAANRVSRAVD